MNHRRPMQLTVIGSGSAGNCYVLQNEDEALVIEAGVELGADLMQALAWNTAKVVAVIVSHHHADHAAYAVQFMGRGIRVRASEDTIREKHLDTTFAKPYFEGVWFREGGFEVLPFPLIHYNTDGTRCPNCGFLIKHKDCGRICFFTDCADFCREVMTDDGLRYVGYDFKDIRLWMIEANYDNYILYRSKLNEHLKDRIKRSHMSIQKAVKVGKRIDLGATAMILLIHISDGNGDERKFVRVMRKATGKRVYAAHRGLSIELPTPTE